MKRVVLTAAVALAQSGVVQARPARPVELLHASNEAAAELAACAKQAGPSIGDIIVDTSWKATASKSLGVQGPKLAACARDALKKHYKPEPPRAPRRRGSSIPEPYFPDTFTLRIGTPTQVLPSPATFMPVWRAAIAPHATPAERDAFAKLLPADYRISNQCIVTNRPYARDLEETWLRGLTVITTWRYIVDELVGSRAMYRGGNGSRLASWDGTGLVTLSFNGLCAERFDPVAARAVFDREGTCWTGSATDILLAPRVEFPKATYTQVSTEGGRSCAVTTTGSVTCCGHTDAALGTPRGTALTQVAVGRDFTCGLDAAGNVTCWGRVTTAPKGAFTKLAAGHYRVCGLHRDGHVECWPDVPSPKGTFADIALDTGACGIHTDGTIECWDRNGGRDLDDDLGTEPPGHWQALAIAGSTVCGLRRDQTVGCTNQTRTDDGMAMSTPVPQKWAQIALASRFGACGIQLDGTIGCSDLHPALLGPQGTPPPAGTFTQIAASHSQFCAVSGAGSISCWGAPWPADPDRAPAAQPTTGLHGTIVDEKGAPIANATVTIDEERPAPPTVSTSAADGTWTSATQRRRTWISITAPGREEVRRYGDQDELARPVVLRPASTIVVVASCDGWPCSAMVELGGGHLHAPPLEHVAPGTYRLHLWRDHGGEHERLAIVEVEMPFAARPQMVRAGLAATGSGHAIRGSVTTTTATSLAGLRVELHCANETYRQVQTDSAGGFELRNVPPLPCALNVDGLTSSSNTLPITSYADVKVPLR